MDREQIVGETAIAFEVLHRRAKAAIGHIAFISFEPVEHLASGVQEHFKLRIRLRHVRHQPPALFPHRGRAEPQQSRRR